MWETPVGSCLSLYSCRGFNTCSGGMVVMQPCAVEYLDREFYNFSRWAVLLYSWKGRKGQASSSSKQHRDASTKSYLIGIVTGLSHTYVSNALSSVYISFLSHSRVQILSLILIQAHLNNIRGTRQTPFSPYVVLLFLKSLLKSHATPAASGRRNSD